jgi:hypothetical protein
VHKSNIYYTPGTVISALQATAHLIVQVQPSYHHWHCRDVDMQQRELNKLAKSQRSRTGAEGWKWGNHVWTVTSYCPGHSRLQHGGQKEVTKMNKRCVQIKGYINFKNVNLWVGEVSPVVECQPSKCESLSSSLSATQNKTIQVGFILANMCLQKWKKKQ